MQELIFHCASGRGRRRIRPSRPQECLRAFGLLTTAIGFVLYPFASSISRAGALSHRRRRGQRRDGGDDGDSHRRLLNQYDAWQSEWLTGLRGHNWRIHPAHTRGVARRSSSATATRNSPRNRQRLPSPPRWAFRLPWSHCLAWPAKQRRAATQVRESFTRVCLSRGLKPRANRGSRCPMALPLFRAGIWPSPARSLVCGWYSTACWYRA